MTEQKHTERAQEAETGNVTGVTAGLWKTLMKWAVRLCVVILLVAASLLTAGRFLLPQLSTQQAAIEAQLGEMLGTRISIGGLQGQWVRFGPVIDIRDLQIVNPDDEVANQVIGSLTIKPALWDSLLARRLVIDEILILAPRIKLMQDDKGGWILSGFASASSGGDYTDAIINFLLTTRRMQIVEGDLALRWADGRMLALDNLYFDLGNTDNLHRALVQGRIAGQANPFQAQVELEGDPRGNFDGKGFIHATQLELADLLEIENLDINTAELSGDLWLSLGEGGITSLQAELDEFSLTGAGSGDLPLRTLALNNGSMQLSLRHDSGRWQGWLDALEFDWQGHPWSADGLYLDYRQETDASPLELSAESLDLAMAADILDDLLELPEQAASALADLQPEGRLTNLTVSTDLEGDMPGLFQLRANLADVAVGAWQGAPSGAGIAGYVQANRDSGFVELDSADFTIHLPRLFNDSWHYDSANSRVYWQLGQEGALRVSSSIIDIRNDFIHGHVQFDLLNHQNSGGEMESELTLMIGILEMDAGYKSLYLPTLDNVRDTMEWLDAALLAGDVSRSGFVSRTSTLADAPENSGTILTFYEVENGRLKFLPEWPELSGISASVTVDNNTVDVSARSAEIGDMVLTDVAATVRPDPQGGSVINLDGGANTSTALGLSFLRNTPVRNNIGSFIDNWRGEGNIRVDIDLDIPLNIPDRNTDILVNVTSNVSTLTIPDYSLSIDQLRGRVVYDSDLGLSANALSGRLFDFPIAATIESVTREDDEGNREITGTRVVGSGRASGSALQAWEGQPQFVRDVLNFASGEIDYLAEITIPSTEAAGSEDSGTSLRLTSELLGLALDMPSPFGKTVDDIRPLELRIDFDEAGQWISSRFDNQVGANLFVSGDNFEGGRITFGPGVQEMTFGEVALDESGLFFRGELNSYDYSAWEETAERFVSMSGNQEPGQQGLEDYISLIDVRVGRLTVIEQELLDVQAMVSRSGGLPGDGEAGGGAGADSWLVSLSNDLLSGSFLFPDDAGRPWNIDLDYLRLPEGEEEESPASEEAEQEDEDIFADVNPGTLPDLDFSADEFTVGDKHLGAWEFQLRASGDSASISDFRMTTPDASIRDLSGETGANLNWRFSEGMHTSSFTGLFRAGDLAQVLPAWGYDANVESESAAFVSNLQWTGSPAAFSLDQVIGDVELDIRDGRFVDVDSGTSRLFGAFSFDSLVRRLQLDFSDLYERGFGFDSIGGKLDFNRGIVRTDGEFVVEGLSSRITADGEIDLVQETIDADLLVNVPLGQNLSVLAGILGAWPIAVSTYVASKIFKDQMDDFTTVLYRLEGPWENPTSGFERTEDIPLEEIEQNPQGQDEAASGNGEQ